MLTRTSNRFRRDAWLEINLDHLEFNIKYLHREFDRPLIPVLKADAYGHGAQVLVSVLDTYDFIYAYGVASIDEALSLRSTTKKKIIVLGISPEWAFEHALSSDIDLTICDLKSAEIVSLLAKKLNKTANLHIKLDTGMNRIGFKLPIIMHKNELDFDYQESDLREYFAKIEKIFSLPNLNIVSAFTHFADPSDDKYLRFQEKLYNLMTDGLPLARHPASSKAASRLDLNTKMDFVRCGIELYGLENLELKPLMSLYSRISHIKQVNQGEFVSYKRTWQAKNKTTIATLPLGYADGVPRSLSNQIKAFCKGRFIDQIGLITMDQIMFDLGDTQDIVVGDVVELIGPHCSIYDWCKQAGTISYELITSLSLRLPKSYTR